MSWPNATAIKLDAASKGKTYVEPAAAPKVHVASF